MVLGPVVGQEDQRPRPPPLEVMRWTRSTSRTVRPSREPRPRPDERPVHPEVGLGRDLDAVALVDDPPTGPGQAPPAGSASSRTRRTARASPWASPGSEDHRALEDPGLSRPGGDPARAGSGSTTTRLGSIDVATTGRTGRPIRLEERVGEALGVAGLDEQVVVGEAAGGPPGRDPGAGPGPRAPAGRCRPSAGRGASPGREQSTRRGTPSPARIAAPSIARSTRFTSSSRDATIARGGSERGSVPSRTRGGRGTPLGMSSTGPIPPASNSRSRGSLGTTNRSAERKVPDQGPVEEAELSAPDPAQARVRVALPEHPGDAPPPGQGEGHGGVALGVVGLDHVHTVELVREGPHERRQVEKAPGPPEAGPVQVREAPAVASNGYALDLVPGGPLVLPAGGQDPGVDPPIAERATQREAEALRATLQRMEGRADHQDAHGGHSTVSPSP